MREQKTFGLVEIVVGVFIIATVFGAILAALVGVRRYINHANRRLDAVNIAREYLNSWVNYVREDTWYAAANPLSTASGNKPLNNPVGVPAPYGGFYTVTDGPGGYYREVQITITYPYD